MKITYSLIFLILLSSCNLSSKDKENQNVYVDNKKSFDSFNILKNGMITYEQLDNFYPKVLDTVKKKAILTVEILKLKPANNITTSILHNGGAFDQMFLCTHNSNFKLIDSKFIGTATDFDDGKSHTIEIDFINNEIIFYQTDWGYVGEEIDTINFIKTHIIISNKGQILQK
jgi:hypothetical protein